MQTFMDVPRSFAYGNTGIVVNPDETELFKEFIHFHQLRHGYYNLDATLKRIRNAGKPVIFYQKEYCAMRYYAVGSTPPRWMSKVPISSLVGYTIDTTDLMSLLEGDVSHACSA